MIVKLLLGECYEYVTDEIKNLIFHDCIHAILTDLQV